MICVDDQPAQLPAGVDSITVFPYLRANPHDRALAPALARLSGVSDVTQRDQWADVI